ncbi:MAG TPA: YlmH/Sll1252 family protein [Patescibacteria group bacterium]|nr:YlmH/Sll1252 family protein [Patescibacteria group bacterium]
MSEREKILRYYRANDDGELAARLLDLAEVAIKSRKYRISEFVDPHGLSIAETIVAHYPQLILATNGGYSGSERVKVAFISDDFSGNHDQIDYQLSALQLSWDERYYHLTHRDVLGALMGLGIKREITGDIMLSGSTSQIVLDSSMAAFVAQNLTSVGQAVISISPVSLTDIAPREEKVKEIRSTVASLRLDAIAAAGFGVSRTKMGDEIAAAKLKVNWQDAKNAAQTVKVGDIISMRGRGRVEICDIPGQTKKGRFSVLLKRYL